MNQTINSEINTKCNICEFLLFWLILIKGSNYNMVGTD